MAEIKTEMDFLLEMEWRLQLDLNQVQQRIGELLATKEVELGEEVHAMRRARFSVVPDLPDGVA